MRHPLLLALPLALLAAACGSSSSTLSKSSSATTSSSPAATTAPAATSSLSARSLPGLGTVLVNGQGRTVYAFTPERGGKIKCTGSCASVWPPVTQGTGKPMASGAVRGSLLGHVAGTSGRSIVTYGGWPLHTYAPDTGPGSDKGQGIQGKWYVIGPSGELITKAAASSGGGYGSGGGAY